MIKIGYEAGHGLNTPGKRTPDDEREWTFNNKVARFFANELALYEGVTLRRFDDPSGIRDVPLNERTDSAKAWGAEFYVSFHHNANTGNWGTWTGVETHIYLNPNSKSIRLANVVQPALVKAYDLRNRGIKHTNLHITREMQKSGIGVILVEGGFMDSTIDVEKLRDDKVLGNAGKLIAQAFADHLGLKNKVIEDPVKLESKLDFYSPTAKGMYEGRIQTPETKKLLVEKAISVFGFKKEWMSNHESGKLKEGDYNAIAMELAIHFAKSNK